MSSPSSRSRAKRPRASGPPPKPQVPKKVVEDDLKQMTKLRKEMVYITPEIKEKFLVMVAKTHRKHQSAYRAGVHPKTIDRELKRDPEFQTAYEDACQHYLDSLEELIDVRARQSDRILELLAKRHIPAYRDKVHVKSDTTVNGTVEVHTMESLAKLPAHKRNLLRQLLEDEAAENAVLVEGTVEAAE